MACVQGKRFDVVCCVVSSAEDDGSGESGTFLRNVFEKFYAPYLLGFSWVRAVVVLLFFLWLCASISLFPLVEVGLDQELSMPEDSYVLVYFQVSSEGISRVTYATGNMVQKASGFHAGEVTFPQKLKHYQTFFFETEAPLSGPQQPDAIQILSQMNPVHALAFFLKNPF